NGVKDHDGKLPEAKLDAGEFGSLYIKGYNQGYQDAKGRSWYIVSLDKENKINSWYIKTTDSNDWAKTKDKATAFDTQEESTK
ncbi:MAG: hypothetical protein GTO02_09580, partial [Candidatus Dadabacteria bacterium]|nr:hypothetical protein [Candidatus Dadabacteria bacterium]